MSSVGNEKLLGENATDFCYEQTDGRTARKNDERIDRHTMVNQYTPSPLSRGIITTIEIFVTILHNIISVSTKRFVY